MTTAADVQQIVSAFLAAREDLNADAARYMAPDFTFESPLMRFDDREKYLASHRAFQPLVLGKTMVSELYGPQEATLVYDLQTATPVRLQRTAEHIRLEDGKVSRILLVFDAAPWQPLFDGSGRLRRPG